MQSKLSYLGWLPVLVALGCAAKDDASDSSATTNQTGQNDTGEQDSSDGGSSPQDSSDDGQTSVTTAEDTSTGGDDTTGNGTMTGVGFITPPDGGGVNIECDIWAQDCPEGEKCMPWANDGGNAWNATRCSPLDPAPASVGDECTVEGSGVSGIDNCEVSSMCWNVDPETNIGTCIAFCMGSEANPVCENPGASCSILNVGTLILCLPNCDPLLQDCNEGEGCYPTNDIFSCVPDAGGEQGAYGEGCEFLNVCDPGLFCANPAGVPNCQGSIGCCSSFCDTTDPNATMNCPGNSGGQECVPWFEEGQAPPGYENLGACVIPA
ncbi:MAG TPA: ribulose phosphate epimerase [Nannocystaceae bacterium]|nr:ribulose phosphate epimerase [Nannocystaceae bacterium]